MEKNINTIISGDPGKVEKALAQFIEKADKQFAFPELSSANKREIFWKAIADLIKQTDNPSLKIKCYTALRMLSREKTDLKTLVSSELIEFMLKDAGLHEEKYVFDESRKPVVLEVQKCLSNVIFNCSTVANICSKNGMLEAITSRIKRYKEPDFPFDVKFFDIKHLFLLTALCSETRNKLKVELHGLTYLTEILESILVEAAEKPLHNEELPSIALNDEQVGLADETLKALFNITLNCRGRDEEELALCMELVKVLRNCLIIPVVNLEKLSMFQNNIINLLTNMPNESLNLLITPVLDEQKVPKNLCFEGQNMTVINEILVVLEKKFKDGPVVSDHLLLVPTITLLFKGSIANRYVRKYLRDKILPPLKDVHKRPEEEDTFRGYLCRLLTSPVTQLKQVTAELLFVLCKKSVKRMIKYTGYGNAAGLFAQKGLLGGRQDEEGEAEFSSESEDSETDEYAEHKHGINPVTGCFESPRPNPMENMTEEQKEYEAMKLVQLIDNLTKCGAIKPCRVGEDGKPEPIEHVLQLQEGLKNQQINGSDDSD